MVIFFQQQMAHEVPELQKQNFDFTSIQAYLLWAPGIYAYDAITKLHT